MIKHASNDLKIALKQTNSFFEENWEDLIAHRNHVYVEGIELFRDFFVVEERANGLTQMRIERWDTGEQHYLDFGLRYWGLSD